MPEYPSGTVAFLFTDIEGSTRRWELHQQAMWLAVERHFALMREAIHAQHGVLFKTIGDAVQAAFPDVPGAVNAAIAAQAALRKEDWGELGPLRVRMAIHVGEATPRDGDYLAPVLNRLARVLSTGYGDQVLLTEAARTIAVSVLPPSFDLLDLGAHRLRDLLQAEHIYQLAGPGLVADFPPLKSLDRHLHNLPAQPTPLLGRDGDVANVRALLADDDARLVTLTGPGGTGKTRLAVQIGAEVVESFADGVWFVPLAAVAGPDLVVSAIAQPLGVREVPGQTLLETAEETLRGKHTLLILDNFEHVVAAAPTVSRLLAAAPNLKVLATSREPLRIGGEREVPVQPLALPDARQAPRLPAGELLEFPAVRLFVERAQAVKPDFALTDANAPDVAAICRRLDGLPLAIELAAARARVLPPAQLLARLDQRLKILTGGSRDLPARQQTLRAAIEWSHDLLTAEDRALFARLAVFAGGCTLEAAEVVCADAGDSALDVLDGLDSLTQKSLVRQEDGDGHEPRFTMLQTIHEFGLERLDASGEEEALRRAHARFFQELAETEEQAMTGPRQVAVLDNLDTEHDNLRAALGWLDERGEGETRLRLAAALWRFWWVRGHLSEGRRWLERALRDAEGLPAAIHAKALRGAGILAESQGDYAQATRMHEAALAQARDLGDQVEVAHSLTDLGIMARFQGDYRRAREFQEQALAVWGELGDESGTTSSLHELGRLAMERGDYAEAGIYLKQCLAKVRAAADASALGPVFESLGELAFYQADFAAAAAAYEESLAAARAIDDARMIAHASAALGEAIQHQGDLDKAEALYREALPLYRELGDKRGTAFALAQLAKIALAREDHASAGSLFAESFDLRREEGDQSAIVDSLEGLAGLLIARGDVERGVAVIAASDARRVALEFPLPPAYAAERDRWLTAARQALSEPEFTAVWNRGLELTIEEAVAEAKLLLFVS
jgi:predicted ATPase/class 3 adenylate cyclase/Tfp pilus assembly protein PilF